MCYVTERMLKKIPVLLRLVFDLETSLGSIWSDWIWFFRSSICSVMLVYCSMFPFCNSIRCWFTRVRFLILFMIWKFEHEWPLNTQVHVGCRMSGNPSLFLGIIELTLRNIAHNRINAVRLGFILWYGFPFF